MKSVVLFHNPSAGTADHEADELVNRIEEQGYACEYLSVKSKKWSEFNEEADFVIAAGGDGCVRRVVGRMLERTLIEPRFPIAIVPLGTANNFAAAFGVAVNRSGPAEALQSLVRYPLDIGAAAWGKKRAFVMEGAGVGVFPLLMKKMKKHPAEDKSPEKKLENTLQLLEQVVQKMRPVEVGILADGVCYDGRYLLVELLNIPSVGPNLVLAPDANPGDGKLELVMVRDDQRDELLDVVKAHRAGKKTTPSFAILRAKEFVLSLPATRLHIDDELVQFKGGEFSVSLRPGLLTILAPPVAKKATPARATKGNVRSKQRKTIQTALKAGVAPVV